MKQIDALLKVIENPLSKKGFQELQQYYLQSGKKEEAKAIEYLLKVKFNVDHFNHNQK